MVKIYQFLCPAAIFFFTALRQINLIETFFYVRRSQAPRYVSKWHK